MGAVQLKSSTLSQLSSQISKINMSPKPEDEVTDAAAAQTEEAKTEETVEAGEAAAAEPEAAEGEAVEEKKEEEAASEQTIPNLVINIFNYINQQIKSKRWCFYSVLIKNSPTEIKKRKFFIYFLIMKKPCHTSSDKIPSLRSSK